MTEEIKLEIEEPKTIEETDKELKRFLEMQRAKVKVFGVGGGGNNTITRMSEIGIKGAEMIAINTDAQDLLYTTATSKILIGKELTFGLGAGSDPRIGQQAAKESETEIRKAMQGANLVFITCGLGGGTGSGAAPIIAEISKKLGILTIAVVTLPFKIEGKRRWENALYGLEKLEDLVDTLIVVPNDKLLELASDLPLQTAFKLADEILTNSVKGITELITSPGLVNLDFADIKAVMSNGGIAMIGVGESDSKDRARDAIEKAISNPLLDIEVEGATGALINIVGGKDMSLDEAKEIIEYVNSKLGDNSKLIWGAAVSEDMGNNIRVLLIMTGIKSPQIFGNIKKEKEKQAEEELGIEFID